MAKEQGISLTPEEITGMCGRLRCCLIYEYEQYVEARKQLPQTQTSMWSRRVAKAKVVDILPMSNKVIVAIEAEETFPMITFDKDEIQPQRWGGTSPNHI